MKPIFAGRIVFGRAARLGLALAAPLALSGCQSDLLPAVFGFGSGGVSAYAPGTLPDVTAHPGDRLIGRSGTDRGRCIFENEVGNRFRADCPEGFSL